MPGSGIFGTLGYAPESTWGTFVAPTHFLTIISEAGEYKKTTIQSKTLHGGLYDLAARRAVSKIGATQSIDIDLYDRGLGLLFKAALGASSVTGTGPYTQVFTPANADGTGISIQVGRPTTNDSTIQAISYSGCKVTDWTISAKAGELDAFTVGFDSKLEDSTQSYTAPSYTLGNVLTAMESSLTYGGTVSTSAGVTSVSGGTAFTYPRDASFKFSNKVDTDRYVLGSPTKLEQLANATRQMTGSITLDFNDLTTAYAAFKADTSFALQLTVTGPIVSGSTHSSIQILLPTCYWDEDNFPVKGPQIVQESLTFTALDDGLGDNPCQVTLVTMDSAI